MAIESVRMKISKNKKIRFLGQKFFPVPRVQTDTQTQRYTDSTQTGTKVNTEDTLSGFQECFLQLIIKDRSNKTSTTPNYNGPIHTLKIPSPRDVYF